MSDEVSKKSVLFLCHCSILIYNCLLTSAYYLIIRIRRYILIELQSLKQSMKRPRSLMRLKMNKYVPCFKFCVLASTLKYVCICILFYRIALLMSLFCVCLGCS